MNTLGEIKSHVLVSLEADTTQAWYTDDILGDFIDNANKWAGGYKKWPFTESMVSTTWTGNEVNDYPEGIKADSIRVLQMGGYMLKKLNFEDYQIFREEESNGDDRVFTDFGRQFFINPNIDLSGTITVWGQTVLAEMDKSVPTSETVFSGAEEEGNEAIAEHVLGYCMQRQHKRDQARDHFERSKELLENIWAKIQGEQFGYHTHSARGGMWKRIDILKGAAGDEIYNRDRF